MAELAASVPTGTPPAPPTEPPVVPTGPAPSRVPSARTGVVVAYVAAYFTLYIALLTPVISTLALKVDALSSDETRAGNLALVTGVGAFFAFVANPLAGEQVYPGGRFAEHLEPFKELLAAGTRQMMPYYGMPVGLEARIDGTTQTVEEVGFGFNRQVLTSLLREQLGFDGIICTDWGLVTDAEIMGQPFPARAWGVEHLAPIDRLEKILDAGADQLGGEACPELVVELVRDGRVAESRIDESVAPRSWGTRTWSPPGAEPSPAR